MILVDFNQVLISNLMSQLAMDRHTEVDENLIRHMVLSSILSYKKKFGSEFGELVFCCDDRNYWRRDVFEHYKANRKKIRDSSKHDWSVIFNCLNKVRDEIGDTFPYKVIKVKRAEADDLIATLCKYSQTHDLDESMFGDEPKKLLILSGDKDFLQLHRWDNIHQFSPIVRKFLHTKDPEGYLQEHIIRGDSGDGIPNFLSADDVFVEDDKRQTPLLKKKLPMFLKQAEDGSFENKNHLKNWKRNKEIIDLDCIPKHICEQIIDVYENVTVGKRRDLFKYFIKHQLRYLSDSISEF